MKIQNVIFLFYLLIIVTNHHNVFADESKKCDEGNIDPILTEKLENLIEDFEGDVGVYIRNLSTGCTVAIRSDELFPTASMVKVPILLTLFDKIESGELKYLEEQIYRDSLLYAGEDILGSFKDGEKILLSKMVMLMTTMSDNTASLWNQLLAETGLDINKWLSEHGFEKTRMNSRTPGREKNWEKYGWG
jgi:beta-lactamase class A